MAPAEVARLAGVEATETWHSDLVLQWNAGLGFSRYGFRWTPGLGFETSPQPEACASLTGAWTPAPQDFPFDIIDVTYNPGTLLRFDFANPIRPVHAWIDNAGSCAGSDGQGGGLPADVYFYEFDNALP